MKSRVLLYCTLLAAVCSCTKSVWQSEDFDIVETNEYVNIYNSKGKWMIKCCLAKSNLTFEKNSDEQKSYYNYDVDHLPVY